MSTVIILTPVIIGAWPAVAAAVTAAAAGLGLVVKEEIAEALNESHETVNQNAVEIELEDSQILAQALARGKTIVLTKDAIQLKISRDDRGSLKVCAEGLGHTKKELETMAEEFVRKMTQCYVYNRTVTELKNNQFQMVNQEVTQDGSIRIHVRRFVD